MFDGCRQGHGVAGNRQAEAERRGQKNAGADYVGNLADTMRRAAREFDDDLPIAGAYIRKAASQVEGVSDQIKTGNLSDLVQRRHRSRGVSRRRSSDMAVLAGFGAVRFLKSSADNSERFVPRERRVRYGYTPNRGSVLDMPRTASGAGYTPNQANRSYSDNRGYRDEFTK